MKKLTFILLMLLTTVSQVAYASDSPNLEEGLIKALKLKPRSLERLGDSGTALKAYIAAGYMDLKPTQRADYTDYRLLKKPATLMGHTLILVEEEYKTVHLGCCVNPGLGVTVRLNGSSKKLEKFADDNGCAFDDEAAANGELKSYGITVKVPKGKYVSLSCRYNEAARKRDGD